MRPRGWYPPMGERSLIRQEALVVNAQIASG
jgi:hypothetical protein